MKELNLNVGLESLNKMNPKVQASNANSNHLSQRLLGNYLKDVEKILRKGESKDDEIDDMILLVPPSDENGISRIRTRAEMQDALIKNIDSMFLLLQKVGWNVQDALEILNLDPKHIPSGHISLKFRENSTISHKVLDHKRAYSITKLYVP